MRSPGRGNGVKPLTILVDPVSVSSSDKTMLKSYIFRSRAGGIIDAYNKWNRRLGAVQLRIYWVERQWAIGWQSYRQEIPCCWKVRQFYTGQAHQRARRII